MALYNSLEIVEILESVKLLPYSFSFWNSQSTYQSTSAREGQNGLHDLQAKVSATVPTPMKTPQVRLTDALGQSLE